MKLFFLLQINYNIGGSCGQAVCSGGPDGDELCRDPVRSVYNFPYSGKSMLHRYCRAG